MQAPYHKQPILYFIVPHAPVLFSTTFFNSRFHWLRYNYNAHTYDLAEGVDDFTLLGDI